MTTTKTDSRTIVALSQHPMWLIIKEDTICIERTPGWGAASIEEYAMRLARNLEVLENTQWARLNYDFSAAELEDVESMFPDIAARIKAAIQRGQLGIVNGTYSQAHLHTLSLEASVRQFAEGVRSIRENYGYQVKTYIMQEPGYTDQTPQIIKAFGYKYAHWGCFIVRCEPLPGETITGKETFFLWKGLDGSEVLGICNSTGVALRMPDMIEVALGETEEHVVLDRYLEDREKHDRSPRPGVRMYIPWSYIEGTDADRLSQLNAARETALVQMETIRALVADRKPMPFEMVDSKEMWKLWLLAQHHDAYWSGAPELRGKSCEWLRGIIQKARQTSRDILQTVFPEQTSEEKGVLLASVYPKHHRGAVTVDWTGEAPEYFIDAEGKKSPVQVIPSGPNKGKLLVGFEARGVEIREMVGKGKAPTPDAPEILTTGTQFSNRHYSLELVRDGSILTLTTGDGNGLIDPPYYTLDAITGHPAGKITASVDGKIRGFAEGIDSARLWKGPVADIFEASGHIGSMPVGYRRKRCAHIGLRRRWRDRLSSSRVLWRRTPLQR